jgi:hypothetical protein
MLLLIEEGCCGVWWEWEVEVEATKLSKVPIRIDNRQKFGCRLELLRGITCLPN